MLSGALSSTPMRNKTSRPSARSISASAFCLPEEQAHWLLDATINDRGIHLDRKLLDAAIEIAEAAQREIDDAMLASPKAPSPTSTRPQSCRHG